MDAMSLGYPPEDRGKISVTATKAEWRDVVDHLFNDQENLTATSAGWALIQELKSWGVE